MTSSTFRRSVVPEPELLQPWARSLIDLGAALYWRNGAERRLMVCVSLPTRVLAAALVAAGAALASLVDDAPGSLEDHFRLLSQTAPGAPVTVLSQGELRSGWLKGPCTVMGQECVGYLQRRTAGNQLRYLFKARCLDMQLMQPDAEPFAIPKKPFEDPLTPDVLEEVSFGAASAAATRYECAAVVFTTLARLEQELDERIHLGRVGPVPLVDLVRPQRFLSRGVPFRSNLVAASGDDLPPGVEENPPVAVFDGPQGYLRLRHCVDAAASVLLLDRWDPNAAGGATQFIADNGWAGRTAGIAGFLPVPGMEVLTFEDAQ